MVFILEENVHKKYQLVTPICSGVQQQDAHICPNKLRQPVVEMNVGGGNTAISFQYAALVSLLAPFLLNVNNDSNSMTTQYILLVAAFCIMITR